MIQKLSGNEKTQGVEPGMKKTDPRFFNKCGPSGRAGLKSIARIEERNPRTMNADVDVRIHIFGLPGHYVLESERLLKKRAAPDDLFLY